MEKQTPGSDQNLKGWLTKLCSGGTWADVLRSPFWQKTLLCLQDSSFFCENVLVLTKIELILLSNLKERPYKSPGVAFR